MIGAALFCAVALTPLPECRAPFARAGLARQDVELVTHPWGPGGRSDTWVEFRMGGKRVVANGFEWSFGNRRIGCGTLAFFVGGDYQFDIQLGRGWTKEKVPEPRMSVDAKVGNCTWTQGEYVYTLRADGPGRIVCDYSFPMPAVLTLRMHRKMWDSSPFVADPAAGVFSFRKDEERFHFEVGTPGDLSATRWDEWTNLQYHLKPTEADGRVARGRLIIDFGKSSSAVNTGYAPVGGVDFWGADAIHVPAKPTRNLLTNGSFEQKFKGWRWQHGGARWSPCEPGQEHYGIVDGGRNGGKCLVLRNTQPKVAPLWSQSMALEPDVPHTLSFWAKATEGHNGFLMLSPKSANAFVGKFHWLRGDCVFSVSNGWHRYTQTFVPDAHGVFIKIAGEGAMIDDIQVERGARATEDAGDPIIADLVTSDPDNDLAPSEPVDAKLALMGEPGRGKVRVRVKNYYSETLYDRTFEATVPSSVDLGFGDWGTGVFVVRMDFTRDGTEWTDYARYSVCSRLRNDQPINRFFANQVWFERFSRGEDIARKMREYGFGMTDGVKNCDYNEEPMKSLFRKNNIGQMIHPIQYEMYNNPKYPEIAWGKPGILAWTNATPERLAFVERTAYDLAANAADDDVWWTFWNEEENSWAKKVGFETHFMFVDAVWRGADRAFRDRGLTNAVKRVPTHGCSHYCVWRNYDSIDGYMAAAAKHGVRYDAITLHTYQNVDRSLLGQYDSDLETQHCIERMRHYGYPEDTPIFFSECWNITPYYLPAWGCEAWADGQVCGAASYDLGNREFLHAGALARLYLIAMKFYPKVAMVHSWAAHYCTFMDNNLTPFMWLKTVNTLAEMFPEPQFLGDARPYADVRGYCFTNRRETARFGRNAVLALWTTNHDVELGKRKGVSLQMALPADARFFDLMGNERAAAEDVPLTPAPLFIVSADGKALLKAVEDAVADDPSTALSLDVRPDEKGKVNLVVRNETKIRQKGLFTLDGKPVNYDLKPMEKTSVVVAENGTEPMRRYTWKGAMSLQPRPWSVDYFYVPKCGARPDWTKIPSLPLGNYVAWEKGERTLKAKFQMAWNEERLFIRVEAEDPKFFGMSAYKEDFKDHLYRYDGSLEVFFDAFADARRQGTKGMDENDSRYDFADGLAKRMRAVNWQLAEGTVSATDEEVAEKLERTFARTEKGYVHEIAFAPRYLAPIDLRAGTVAGVGLMIHDYDSATEWTQRGVSNATQPGAACDGRPWLWPLFILTDAGSALFAMMKTELNPTVILSLLP